MKFANRPKGSIVSRCSRGQGVVRYANTVKFAVPAARDFAERDMQAGRDYNRDKREAHEADRERQTREAGTNWDLVRFVLDNRPNLTLEDAKRIVRNI